ncbi:uncharacterized protein BO95DRAFT_443947 [Aspergillus brunneoviolaceus CBS 621.78]|uniref:Uncharacterized protein n=1 Tax=Aspergillus brunneoviolaceus CBS 621.78 TaxID=1450534 RepID=A0ACD1G690_9EURO|nr:hypothetical protein BO95DRAFT_443947 [Aspergillus brunneoviolaceus CBS 621.78]RAH44750.1 hypothetical protein BO95DRAFT_443947 [Aspergillus brunneoviolaceus CBS 621.78]
MLPCSLLSVLSIYLSPNFSGFLSPFGVHRKNRLCHHLLNDNDKNGEYTQVVSTDIQRQTQRRTERNHHLIVHSFHSLSYTANPDSWLSARLMIPVTNH